MYKAWIKRLIDFIVALVGSVALSPLLLLLAVLVRVKLGSPILFTQERPGKNEKIFRLYKFRTMTEQKNDKGELLPDAVRLTKFGKILRATSLDELPELLNILKGDMSFIGPRPLLISYLSYYSEKEKIRHTVRPGLTGLAQASGRNFLNWDIRLLKDIEYVEHLSFIMDVKVILKTIHILFGKEDSVAEDTNAIEGNFAEIRKKRLEETGALEK